ncbi:aminoglycoside phosphotransferase family protein [Phenylobacterium sp.]|uniref:aminoglycoside phosphotransferase family protein n=1 Tax=Phenylobacterium sp. TaxID=1871053 RepID=UPI0035C7D740
MRLDLAPFAPWLALWDLVPEGEVVSMPLTGSRLLPVSAGGRPAMLKLAASADERRGAEVMAWWAGEGAAPVLAHAEEALLMARAEGKGSLVDLVKSGGDAAAMGILCEAIDRLHRPRQAPPPALPPLSRLFRALEESADPRLAGPRGTAARLLADQHDLVVLHGDLHHDNVLDFGSLGWRAIDPWGYVGERAYDYANLFRNPDAASLTPERTAARLDQVSSLAGLRRERLLEWIYAHAGLSAAWDEADGEEAERSWAVLRIVEPML